MKVKIGKYPKHRWYSNFLYEKFGWRNEPTIKVKIDEWDTWSMDHTLSHIILPMLKQLNKHKHGAPYVSLDDVPQDLWPPEGEVVPDGDTDSSFFKRWDWVMGEMIFAFQSKDDDWEARFSSGEHDMLTIKRDDGFHELVKGPNDTYKVDWEGRQAYQDRISNGFRLFGKYYENLWD